MTKTEYSQYLQSSHWKSVRKANIVSDSTCEKCSLPRWLSSVAYGQDLHLHHLSYANLGAEKFEDLQVLCPRCHEKETFGTSSLPEIKRVSCLGCGDEIFDLYFRRCEVCRMFEGYDRPFLGRLQHKTSVGDAFWEIAIREIVYATMRGILDGMEVQKFIDAAVEKVRLWQQMERSEEETLP